MFSSVTSWLGVGSRPKESPESSENKENNDQSSKGQVSSESKDSIVSSTSVETSIGSSKEGLSEAGSEDTELKASTTSDSSQEPTPLDTLEDVSAKALQSAKQFGKFSVKMAMMTFKNVASTATTTATKLKHTVEEKTILGDFSKEQDKFVEQKKEKSKTREAAVAPWVGYSDEDQLKTQILALSKDKRNFVRNPPSGVQFQFDFDSASPVATATLQEDPNLRDMRFQLVPKQVSEETFWRNYFYRVSLIRQSSQLASSLAQTSGSSNSSSRRSSTGSDKRDSSPRQQKGDHADQKDKSGNSQTAVEADESELASSPPAQEEFASDAFGDSGVSEEEIRREMEQQMLGGSATDATTSADAGKEKDEEGRDWRKDLEEKLLEQQGEDWEAELQQELQDYELVGGAGDDDNLEDNDELEREIMQQIEQEAKGGVS